MWDVDCEEGFTPNPTVFVRNSERTSVLDKNGEPYTLSKKNPVGFNLKDRAKNEHL